MRDFQGALRGRFMTKTTEIGYNSKIEGEVVHTTVDAAINWFRKNSLWPMPMGLACCGIELMASGCSRFDISRFGSEVMRFSPAIGRDDRGRHGDLQNGHGGEADLRSNGGAEMGDRHGRVRQQRRHVPQLRGVAGCGSNCTGGCVHCRLPSRPEAILEGLMKLQGKVSKEPWMKNHFDPTPESEKAGCAS